MDRFEPRAPFPPSRETLDDLRSCVRLRMKELEVAGRLEEADALAGSLGWLEQMLSWLESPVRLH